MSKMDSDHSELSKQVAPQIEQNNKLVAEALNLHKNPNIGATENQIAQDWKTDRKTVALTVLGLEKLADSTENSQTKSTAYRDLAVLNQSMALEGLGGPDKETTKLFLSDGAAKWITKLEQTDPNNPDLKNLKTIQNHMSEAVDSPDSQNPTRKYNPTFDTTMLYGGSQKRIGQIDTDKVATIMGHGLSAEWMEAKNGSVQAAAGLQRFADTAPFYKSENDILKKTLEHTDPEAATRLRRAMLKHETIQFE